MEVVLSKDIRELANIAQFFKNGLESLNSAVTRVTSTNSISIKTLRQMVREFDSNFKKAATEAKSVEQSFCIQHTRLVEEKSAIENRLRNKQREKEQLEINLRTQKSELSNLQDQLQDARDDVRSSETTLRSAEEQLSQKKSEQAAVLAMGVASFFIPVVGLVAGPTLIGISLTALEKNKEAAEQHLDEAECRLKQKQDLVSDRKRSVTYQENRIKDVSRELDLCEIEKHNIEKRVHNIEEQYNRLSGIRVQLQDGVTYLEKTAGRSQIISHELKFFYGLGPLFVSLKSLACHLAPGLSLHPAFSEDSALQNFQLCLEALENSSENERKNMQLTLKYRERIDIDDLRKHLRCEQFLVPAPMTLALLGQVCTLSLKHDFSLEASRPKDGFKFLKSYSFRANLQEITHLVWSAFNTAHVNMDQIHIYTETLPIHLSNALHMMENDMDDDFEDRFNNCLKGISSTSVSCLSLSRAAEDAFIKVIETLMELQESCTCAKGMREKQLQENKINMKQNQEIKENILDQRRLHTERLANLREKTQETEREYQNSIQLPGVLEAAAVGIAEHLSKGIQFALSALSKPIIKRKRNDEKIKKKRKVMSPEKIRSYEIAKTLLKQIQTLNESYVKDDTLNKHVLENCEKMIEIKQRVRFEESRLHKMAESCVQKNLLVICLEVIAICEFLQDFKYYMNNDDQSHELVKTAKSMKALEIRLHEITEQGEKDTADEPQNKINPVEVPCTEEAKDGGLVSYTIQKYRMKSKARLHQLENLEHMYDKEASDLKENREQLAEILGEMASLKMDNIDFESTLDVLRKSLRSLAEIREQWGKVVQYFQSVVAILDCSLNVSLQNIGKYAKGGLTDFKMCMLHDQVLSAKQLLAGLNHVSESYTEVSEEFLLPTTKDLQGILGLTKSDFLIEAELKLFKRKCSNVQEEIQKLLERRQTTFLSQVERRVSLDLCLPSSVMKDDEVDDFC